MSKDLSFGKEFKKRKIIVPMAIVHKVLDHEMTFSSKKYKIEQKWGKMKPI